MGEYQGEDFNSRSSLICFGVVSHIRASRSSCTEQACHEQLDILVCRAQNIAQHAAVQDVPLQFVYEGEAITVHLASGQYLGLLSSRQARILQQISVMGAKLQAFLNKERLNSRDEWTFAILVNVYGACECAQLVGEALSKHDLYLQDPAAAIEHAYRNA